MPINYLQDTNFNKSRCIIHNSTAFLLLSEWDPNTHRASCSFLCHKDQGRALGGAAGQHPLPALWQKDVFCCSDWSFKAFSVWSCRSAACIYGLGGAARPFSAQISASPGCVCRTRSSCFWWLILLDDLWSTAWRCDAARLVSNEQKKSVYLRNHRIGWRRPNLSSSLELNFHNSFSLTLKM